MPDTGMTEVNIMPLRVYYEDTDAGGIVYYANYLKFAERARTELLRTHGLNHADLLASDKIAFAVRECHADYIKPARLDDLLEVRTRVTEVGGAALRMHQDICRDGTVLVAVHVRLACMDVTTGAPKRLPDAVRECLRGHAGGNVNEGRRAE